LIVDESETEIASLAKIASAVDTETESVTVAESESSLS